MEAAWVESSIYFTCMEQFLDIGLGIGGLRQAPYNCAVHYQSASDGCRAVHYCTVQHSGVGNNRIMTGTEQEKPGAAIKHTP